MQIDPRHPADHSRETSVRFGREHVAEQPGAVLIQGTAAFAAGFLSQGARQP
jgi:hypothetical protein